MADVLIADICTAELGWELMCWQGYVRALAKDFETVIVCSTEGHEPLYTDLKPIFVPHRITGLRDAWTIKKVSNPKELSRVRARLDEMQHEFELQGKRVRRVSSTGFIPLSEQCFIPYGSPSEGRARFDVIVHARTKRGKNPLINDLNWSQKEWDNWTVDIRDHGYSVAAIGTREAALAPKNATDLRGADLSSVMDALANGCLAVGPSSGPMHLASLCRTPHLVWVPPLHGTATKAWGSTRERYETLWNPFNTPHTVIEQAGHVDCRVVLELATDLLITRATQITT